MSVFTLAFRPRIVDALKGYTLADFRADLIAGLMVGVVALPLAMAFGIASGVKPEFHLRGRILILSGPHTQPLMTMARGGFIEMIGEQNLCENLDTALERAREIMAAKKGNGDTSAEA